MSQHTKTYEVVIQAKTHEAAAFDAHAVIVQADNEADAIAQACKPFYKVGPEATVHTAQLVKK